MDAGNHNNPRIVINWANHEKYALVSNIQWNKMWGAKCSYVAGTFHLLTKIEGEQNDMI